MSLDFKWPLPQNKPSYLWNIASSLVLKLDVANKVTVYNKNILMDVLSNNGKKPIITFSNHYSCMDDPGLWDKVRWALGAYDILFTTYRHQLLFSLGKVIPIVRGDGVYQKGMEFCLDLLNNNSWVHIFPEGNFLIYHTLGKVNIDKEYIRFKWGIGRLIADCQNIPIILPFYHLGMDKILPNQTPYIPRLGKHVNVYVGEPINITDLVKHLKSLEISPVEMRKKITDYLQNEFFEFRKHIESNLLNKNA